MSRLKELRAKSGLTLREVGDALGTHFTTIQKLEDGRLRLSADRMTILAQIYGVSLGEVVGVPDMPDVLVINGVEYRKVGSVSETALKGEG